MARQTDKPFAEALPELLGEMSLRGLADRLDMNVSSLSRMLSGDRGRRPTLETIMAVADVFDLPATYFAEVREALVIDAIREDPRLRDELFGKLRLPSRRRHPSR